MPVGNTLESRVAYRVKRSRQSVFFREDFEDLGGYDQVGRVLCRLVAKGMLVKVGYGLYVRAKQSSLTGNTIPEKSLQEVATEALERLGAEPMPSEADRAYNQGRTTQVPSGRQFKVKGRVSRKIGYKGNYINYEASA